MLTLQFIPYSEIVNLSSEARIKKLLDVVKENKIVLMEGRLEPTEESALIQNTMENVNKDFKGIELCTVYPDKRRNQNVNAFKDMLIRLFIGNRGGVTIIGPATIVKEIRRNPNKIELLTTEYKRKRKG